MIIPTKDNWVEEYIESHKDDNIFEGYTLKLHIQSIKDLVAQTECKTLLDYGCGKGLQYTEGKLHEEYLFDIMPSLYDPGVDKYKQLPEGNFDGVYSTDVLEHIPEEELDRVLTEIFSKADKFVYLGICTVPAQHILSNGENAHVTVQPFDWWVQKILPYAKVNTMVHCYGNTKGTARIQNNNIIFKKER